MERFVGVSGKDKFYFTVKILPTCTKSTSECTTASTRGWLSPKRLASVFEIQLCLWRRPFRRECWGLRYLPRSFQVPANRGGVSDRCNHLHLAPADGASFQLQIECSGQQRGPCQSVLARRGGLFVGGLFLSRDRQNDFFSVLGMRRKNPMVTHGVFGRRGNQCRQLFDLPMDVPSVIVEILQLTAQFQQSSMSSMGERRIAVVPSLHEVFR